MNRRRLLEAVAASVALAGCAGRPGREQPGDSDAGAAATPTPSPTTSPTSTPPPYGGPTVTDAAPCPGRPESWTRSTVESFLLAFERAYLERSIRRQADGVTDVSHDFGLSVADLAVVEAGYLATLSGGYAVYYGGGGDDETAVHGDVFDYEARYLVARNRLRRTVSTGGAADPREAGQRVFCPPRNPQEPP